MSTFSEELIARSGYLNEGFADIYDRYRPSPPDEVLEILAFLVGRPPRLVVDLGCGTGLSSRVWAARAEDVVGVDPNPQMLERARATTAAANVRYLQAYATETGVADGSAELVTAWQSFHWMEPQAVLAEAARILRRDGVFAACDYDVRPFVRPDVDAAFGDLLDARREARQRLGLPAGAASWPKDGHLEQIKASGHFRFAREVVAHAWCETSAERIVGLAESIGGPRELFGEQAPKVGATFERLRETTNRVLGERTWPAVFCYRIRFGIK